MVAHDESHSEQADMSHQAEGRGWEGINSSAHTHFPLLSSCFSMLTGHTNDCTAVATHQRRDLMRILGAKLFTWQTLSSCL